MGGNMTPATNPAAENRRRQLRKWIDQHFGGSQTQFILSTNDGEKQINQGELSGLLGKKSFGEKCSSCHGTQAQGLIGPNLTDSFWLHGNGSPSAIAKVIQDGVPDKGMPSWGPLLSRDELTQIAAYLVSLKGSHPAGAKAPQGPEYP